MLVLSQKTIYSSDEYLLSICYLVLRSLPKEKSTRLAATATAAPLEDPPGTLECAAGLVGVP